MERNDRKRTRRVTFRLTPEEFAGIEKNWKNSTSLKLSDYIRNHLFGKAIIRKYRNQSLDDFTAEMALLRRELNRIGVNYNQVVKRLHTLQSLPEFKRWLITHEVEKRTLLNKVDEIKKHIRGLTEKWLR